MYGQRYDWTRQTGLALATLGNVILKGEVLLAPYRPTSQGKHSQALAVVAILAELLLKVLNFVNAAEDIKAYRIEIFLILNKEL